MLLIGLSCIGDADWSAVPSRVLHLMLIGLSCIGDADWSVMYR